VGASKKTRSDWKWKVGKKTDNTRLGMRYEPGNWGDILKGTWGVTVGQAASMLLNRKSVRYLDPFAGAPTYALTESATQRMRDLSTTELARHASPFVSKSEWPSTALLIRSACEEHGISTPMRVFDADSKRRNAWAGIPDTEICKLTAGEAILASACKEEAPCELILVDPYDFLADWKTLLNPILLLSEQIGVLCYIYNRAPRSVGHLNVYKQFRKALDEGLAERKFLLGRLASDERLPRAYHEILLLGPSNWISTLREPLLEQTLRLARRLAEAGAFEER